MLVVSPLLKRVVYPALHHTGCLDRVTPSAGYAVVNYHGMLPAGASTGDLPLDGTLVHPEAFRQQLQFLKTHYHVIHPEEFRASIEERKPLPSRSVLLTCDDGLVNAFTEMLPVMQSENVSCLFFVTAESCTDQPGMLWFHELYHLMRINPLIGMDQDLPTDEESAASPQSDFHSIWWSTVKKASRWDRTTRAAWLDRVRASCSSMRSSMGNSMESSAVSSASDRQWRLMGTAELKQLTEAGMTIGAHSLSHAVLSLCSDEEARSEIQDSKIQLERALGRPVWAFAYPFGYGFTVGERELRMAQESGYSCAFVNVEHWDTECNFALQRTHVTSDMTLPEFAAHLSGVHKLLQRAVTG